MRQSLIFFRFLMVISLATLSSTGAAIEIGFETGSDFEATRLEGNLHLSCQERGKSKYRYIRCQQYRLEPSEFAYLQTSEPVEADRVKLISDWRNGHSERKTFEYDSARMRTSVRVNLWIDTLFQDPLLGEGENRIKYIFSKDGNEVLSGQFIAKVHYSGVRTCPTRRMQSGDLSDCDFTQRTCDRYFQLERHCQ